MDNDSFSGTPLPPEEPTAENPPNGALIDYFLPAAATIVQIEIFDAQRNLVRRFASGSRSSDNAARDNAALKHPLAIADRWLPKPQSVETTAGMHRLAWDLTWQNSGDAGADEDSEYRTSNGPKAIPGIYQVRLSVDGRVLNESLKVVMDPRSPATPEILAQQLQLSQKILGDVVEARRSLAEMSSTQKKLADIQQQLEQQKSQDENLKSSVHEAQAALLRMYTGRENEDDGLPGLKSAYLGLQSALRVVESGDREVPSQAVAVYEDSSQQAKARRLEWKNFKNTTLPQLNELLRKANLSPIVIA